MRPCYLWEKQELARLRSYKSWQSPSAKSCMCSTWTRILTVLICLEASNPLTSSICWHPSIGYSSKFSEPYWTKKLPTMLSSSRWCKRASSRIKSRSSFSASITVWNRSNALKTEQMNTKVKYLSLSVKHQISRNEPKSLSLVEALSSNSLKVPWLRASSKVIGFFWTRSISRQTQSWTNLLRSYKATISYWMRERTSSRRSATTNSEFSCAWTHLTLQLVKSSCHSLLDLNWPKFTWMSSRMRLICGTSLIETQKV